MPDPTAPNQGYPYTDTNVVHSFKDAPGASDGIKMSWFNRKKDTPFGGEFDYTDPNDLTGRFLRPGDRWSRWGRIKMALRQWIGKHSVQPVAWISVDSDECPVPSAHLMTSKDGEVKISLIPTKFMVPVWPENHTKAMLAMDGYEATQDAKARAEYWAKVNGQKP